MPIITYTGPDDFSPSVEVAPASTLSLPRNVSCNLDEEHAAKLLAAHPAMFTQGEATTDVAAAKPKRGTTP